jgi:enoyl-CoA hydratase/carnithine racemase
VTETLLQRQEDGIAVLTFNRPEAKNALNDQLLDELQAALSKIDGDEEVRVVVVAGREDCFCAGADIRTLRSLSDPLHAHRFCEKIQKIVNQFGLIGQPVIAAVAGAALGGGTEISLACDIRIAADNAIFGQTEVNLGFIPGAGGTQRLPRTVGLTVAAELLFTGRRVDAQEALAIGLVNKVVPVKELMSEAMDMARILASKPPLAVRMIKSLLHRGMQMPLSEALIYEARCFDFLSSTRDLAEGINAFLEKRRPKFVGR